MIYFEKVKEDEILLVYKNEKLIDILEAGNHRFFSIFSDYSFLRWKIDSRITYEKSAILLKKYPDIIKKYFHIVKLEANERAFVFLDGKFEEILNLGVTALYWKDKDIKVERIDVKENIKVPDEYVPFIGVNFDKKLIKYEIESGFEAYLHIDGSLSKSLSSGRHYFFKDFHDIDLKIVDKRIQELEINAQEILSSDKVTIRTNVTLFYSINDGELYVTSTKNPDEFLYKQLQFIVREHIGSLTIDEILVKQHGLNKDIEERFIIKAKEIGIEIDSINIKDIILPGDMREIFNQVIESKKRAEANIINRREETAATRSLLNTAKLIKDNPTLAKLKELETLENITKNVNSLNIYNGLDGMVNNLVSLKRS